MRMSLHGWTPAISAIHRASNLRASGDTTSTLISRSRNPRNGRERIVQAINRPTKDNALLFINAWGNTRQVRATESKGYAVLNDEQSISSGVIESLRNYDIRPVPCGLKGGPLRPGEPPGEIIVLCAEI